MATPECIDHLVDRAQQLGVTDEICALMEGYLDRVERAAEGYREKLAGGGNTGSSG